MNIKNYVKSLENIEWQELKNWEFNDLKDNEKRDVSKLKSTIQQDGFSFPFIAWQKGKYVIDGTGRRQALTELEQDGAKIEKLPVVFIEAKNKQDAKKKALLISSNYGDITKSSLKLFLQDLQLDELQDIQIGQKPINFDDMVEKEKNDDEVPDDAPQIAKLGDIYQLGEHRLMCGSSTSAEDMEKLMNGELADMVFTDPPYNVNYKGRGKNTSNGIKNDHMEDSEFDTFLLDVFKETAKATKKNAPMYIFHSESTMHQFKKTLAGGGIDIITLLIWNKPTASMGWSDYRHKYEPFFYAKKKDAKIKFYGDRTQTTIWDDCKTDKELLQWAKEQKEAEQNGKTTIWTMKRANVNEYVHPTQKPVGLIEKAIKNSSQRQEIVLEQFAGSGSTIIACEKLNRKCYAMELDPQYIDIIIKRWENYTNKKAIKL